MMKIPTDTVRRTLLVWMYLLIARAYRRRVFNAIDRVWQKYPQFHFSSFGVDVEFLRACVIHWCPRRG